MVEFNVINYNINSREFESYNIIPYLLNCYNKDANKPKTFDEFKEFVRSKAMYRWWSRCEYEIILSPWPYLTSPSERYDKKGEDDIEAWKEHWKKHLKECKKIDVWDQIKMNLDVITKLFMEVIND
mgnify:CR=1 FL=1